MMDMKKLKESVVDLLSRIGLKRCTARVIDMTSPMRIINRDGKVQLHLDQISLGKRKRYWRNPLTTLLDLKWRWVMVIYCVGFIFTWLIFAVAYYVIAKQHGDFDHIGDPNFKPCMLGINSFTSAFLFSLETQHTIGYGSRNPTSECSEVTFTVFLQFMIGVAVQCVTAGLVVAKLQSGKRTSNALVFSEKACVGRCEGEVCLMVRVGNAGRSEVVNPSGFGVLIERNKVPSGEEILSESILEFVSENGSEHLNLLWPAIIHCIILDNPKEFITKLQSRETELIVIIEAILKSTGQMLQLRSSYLCHEIEIGKQFVDISPRLVMHKGGKNFHHELDYADFNVTQPDLNWDYQLWSPKNMI